MNRCQRVRGMLLALAIGLFAPMPAMHAQSAAPLHLGDVMPDVSGQSLSGSPVHLSIAVSRKTAVVVFSFSKAGGKDMQLWNKNLLRDSGSNGSVALSTVIMLESAPRLLRGVIVSKLKKDTPPPLQSGTIVSYQDEQLWKQRLGVADDSRAYVLLLDHDGRVRWINSAAFSDTQYAELRTKIQAEH